VECCRCRRSRLRITKGSSCELLQQTNAKEPRTHPDAHQSHVSGIITSWDIVANVLPLDGARFFLVTSPQVRSKQAQTMYVYLNHRRRVLIEWLRELRPRRFLGGRLRGRCCRGCCAFGDASQVRGSAQATKPWSDPRAKHCRHVGALLVGGLSWARVSALTAWTERLPT
jgi:hypothetical protein